MDIKRNSDLIRAQAKKLGFDHCGFALADFLQEEQKGLEKWLAQGFHGGMSWLERNVEMRLDPRKLEPWARSVICLMLNYYPPQKPAFSSGFQISKYAWGRDYHKVIRKRMKSLIDFMQQEIGDIQARGFVDSGPVMERAWARRTGLGWIGKNSLTLVKRGGSFYFLGVILCDLDLNYDKPSTLNYCGDCTLCIDACPTQAIVKSGVVDARRCLSYLTIESKDEIPIEFKGKTQKWIFGCDICQDVCPHNKRYSISHQESEFVPPIEWFSMSEKEWLDLNQETFERLIRGTPIKRTGYNGFMRNLTFAKD